MRVAQQTTAISESTTTQRSQSTVRSYLQHYWPLNLGYAFTANPDASFQQTTSLRQSFQDNHLTTRGVLASARGGRLPVTIYRALRAGARSTTRRGRHKCLRLDGFRHRAIVRLDYDVIGFQSSQDELPGSVEHRPNVRN